MEICQCYAVHKKDRKQPAENYRPISLLLILGKVLELGVCFRLYDHVKHFLPNIIYTIIALKKLGHHNSLTPITVGPLQNININIENRNN
jgi:hypothetical protein